MHSRSSNSPERLALACFARLLAVAVLAAMALPSALAHKNDAYSHNADINANMPRWMSRLPDFLRLSELSVPGTHDTMARYGGDIAECQSMSITTQLNSGIRYVDIRVRNENDKFEIYHGIEHQNADFDDVLGPIAQFLKDNPGETVFMRVKKERNNKNSTMTFEEVYESYKEKYQRRERPKLDFWHPSGSDGNPTLGEMRGKVVLFDNFTGESDEVTTSYGLKHNNSVLFRTESSWDLGDNWDLHRHWRKKRGHLITARAGSRDYIYMTTLNGANGSFPYFVASGHSSPGTSAPRLATGLVSTSSKYPDFPRKNGSILFEGVNTLVNSWIKRENPSHVGIVVSDFPGRELIGHIVNRNFTRTTLVFSDVRDKYWGVKNSSNIVVKKAPQLPNVPTRFGLKFLPNGRVGLIHGDRYLTEDPQQNLIRGTLPAMPPLPETQYELIQNGDGSFSLKNVQSQQHVSATTELVKVNQSNIVSAAKFKLSTF